MSSPEKAPAWPGLLLLGFVTLVGGVIALSNWRWGLVAAGLVLIGAGIVSAIVYALRHV